MALNTFCKNWTFAELHEHAKVRAAKEVGAVLVQRSIASLLFLTIIAQSIGYAHQDAGQAIKKLSIVIVEGEGAVNNARQRVARDPIVQVEDENRKPVAGAVVVFLLPNQGAGAAFANGARSLTVLTDGNGQAVARGMQANKLGGQYQMRVTASSNGQTTSTSINMSNAVIAGAAVGGLSAAKWLLIVGAIGGAAVGTGIALSNGGGPARTNPTVITPGTPGVGAPR